MIVMPARGASAQGATRLVGEVGLGYGGGDGGIYRNRDGLDRHASLAIYRTVRPHWALYLEALLISGVDTGEDVDCRITSQGRCLRDYPRFGGPIVSAGVVRTLGRAFELRVGGGIGAHGYQGTQVRAMVGQLDITMLVARHWGIVYGTRHTIVPDFRGDRLTRTIGLLGVRVR